MTTEFKTGGTYFLVEFEDTGIGRPIVETFEFLRQSTDREETYQFRVVGSYAERSLGEPETQWLVDLDGLIDLLSRFRDGEFRRI